MRILTEKQYTNVLEIVAEHQIKQTSALKLYLELISIPEQREPEINSEIQE